MNFVKTCFPTLWFWKIGMMRYVYYLSLCLSVSVAFSPSAVHSFHCLHLFTCLRHQLRDVCLSVCMYVSVSVCLSVSVCRGLFPPVQKPLISTEDVDKSFRWFGGLPASFFELSKFKNIWITTSNSNMSLNNSMSYYARTFNSRASGNGQRFFFSLKRKQFEKSSLNVRYCFRNVPSLTYSFFQHNRVVSDLLIQT